MAARALVVALLGALLVAPAAASFAPAPAPGPMYATLPGLSATAAVDLLCSRVVTAVQYVDALLTRYNENGFACLNPFITLNTTKVREDAAAIDAKAAAGGDIRPLCGLPLAVKDAIDILGYPTTAATPALKNNMPTRQPPLIQQYLDANGIVLGKANLAELQATIDSINPNNDWITTPLNAYDPSRIAGGSSGGSANAVAARLAPFSLCEDTGGSCRSPAIANGIFGLRPTLGCYNFSDGLVPALTTRDTVGSMGRTAADLALLDSIVRQANASTTLHGALPAPVACAANVSEDMSLAGVRLGLPSTFGWGQGISSEVAEVTSAALARLRAAGAVLVPFDSSALNAATDAAWAGGGVFASFSFESSDALSRYLYRANKSISVPEVIAQINRPDTKDFFAPALTAYADTPAGSFDNYVNYLQKDRPAITKAWVDTFTNNSFDALLYPGFTTEISRIDNGDKFQPFTNASGTFLRPYNDMINFFLDAQAGMTVGTFPIGFGATGTPFGLQFAAPPGQDGRVLSLLLAAERLFGNLPPPPEVPACAGCVANVTNVQANYNASSNSVPNATTVWTSFGLTFSGNCHEPTLSNYGQAGPVGAGALQNATGPVPTVSNVTVASAG